MVLYLPPPIKKILYATLNYHKDGRRGGGEEGRSGGGEEWRRGGGEEGRRDGDGGQEVKREQEDQDREGWWELGEGKKVWKLRDRVIEMEIRSEEVREDREKERDGGK